MSLYYCANCARALSLGDIALVEARRRPLTRKQFLVYRYVAAFVGANGYAPSFEQIARQFHYRSLATVHEHLTNIERKGWIARRYNEARALECLVSLDDLPVAS